jgi:hypothetical protein
MVHPLLSCCLFPNWEKGNCWRFSLSKILLAPAFQARAATKIFLQFHNVCKIQFHKTILCELSWSSSRKISFFTFAKNKSVKTNVVFNLKVPFYSNKIALGKLIFYSTLFRESLRLIWTAEINFLASLTLHRGNWQIWQDLAKRGFLHTQRLGRIGGGGGEGIRGRDGEGGGERGRGGGGRWYGGRPTSYLQSFPPNFQDETLAKRACSGCDDLLSLEILYTYCWNM